MVAGSSRILVFTGAGISTEAGIPDFRGEGGLWSRFDPAQFTIDRFRRDPAAYWRARFDLMRELDLPSRSPTAAHLAIAAAARTRRVVGVATQNVDGLHERAGTPAEKLARLHGSAWEVECSVCHTKFPFSAAEEDLARGVLPPRCGRCDGALKPGTVLFGEEMPQEPLERAFEWARTCDLCLVVGSSLSVWPAARVPEIAIDRGARLVIVNHDETPMDHEADAVLREAASAAVPRLLR